MSMDGMWAFVRGRSSAYQGVTDEGQVMRHFSGSRFARAPQFAVALAIVLFSMVNTARSETDFNKPTGYFDTAADPDFGPAAVPLRVMMAEAGVPRGRADVFCIVGYRYAGGERIAYVHWPRGNKLILWEGGTDPVSRPQSIARSRRPLDLRTDVVATPADIGSSTYLIDRAWVNQKIADCAKHGRHYRVAARVV
jgi:hypothetical protein